MPKDIFHLEGKVAIVTGGNGGIGFGIAKGLAAAGATIMVAARNQDKTAQAVTALQALGVQAMGFRTDVQDEASVQAMVQATARAFGHVDVLVNNAGIGIRNAPQDYTLAEWQQVVNVNLTGVFLCSRAVYPHMVNAGGGKIINIGSHVVDLRERKRRVLRCQQGRGGTAQQKSGPCLGSRQRAGQYHSSGLDTHGADRSRQGEPRTVQRYHHPYS